MVVRQRHAIAAIRGPQGQAEPWLVPFFYYSLYVLVIHAVACVVSPIREGAVNPWLLANHPLAPGRAPDGCSWSLPLLSLVFAIVVTLLYVRCRMKHDHKRSSRQRYLGFVQDYKHRRLDSETEADKAQKQIGEPTTTGDDDPLGTSTFHFTFLSGPISVGGRWSSAMPEALGPRNWGQGAPVVVG